MLRRARELVGAGRVELPSPACHADVLPLNYAPMKVLCSRDRLLRLSMTERPCLVAGRIRHCHLSVDEREDLRALPPAIVEHPPTLGLIPVHDINDDSISIPVEGHVDEPQNAHMIVHEEVEPELLTPSPIWTVN